MTTTATARTSPASSPATATTRYGEKAGHRAGRLDRRAQGARRATAQGTISNIIAALELGEEQRDDLQHQGRQHVGRRRRSTSPYWTDPLTLAAKAVTDKGITVVAAAGNLGQERRRASCSTAAITAPGNAPWVLTVGASTHERHADARTTTRWRASARRGRRLIDFGGEARPRRAWHRHGLAGGPGQHASTSTKATSLLAGKLGARDRSRI